MSTKCRQEEVKRYTKVNKMLTQGKKRIDKKWTQQCNNKLTQTITKMTNGARNVNKKKSGQTVDKT